ncbi:hypothetical protein GCM10028807_48420 [Spirosoma daeguense]
MNVVKILLGGWCAVALSSGFMPTDDTPWIRYHLETAPSRSQVDAEKTLGEALRTSNPRLFDQLRQSLRQTPNAYTTYWTNYATLYESIYYLQKGDKEQAEKVIMSCVRLAEEQPPRTSEDYALLAYLQSYAIQFRYGLSAGMAASKVKRNANEALKLDPKNPRAYYVLGSNDFYTPARYGGGKTAESYLLKVLTLPEQSMKNPQAPAWGRENAYELLIRLYVREKKLAQAKSYYAKAKQLYPDNYALKTLAKQVNA